METEISLVTSFSRFFLLMGLIRIDDDIGETALNNFKKWMDSHVLTYNT
jgi:hypothetical protein